VGKEVRSLDRKRAEPSGTDAHGTEQLHQKMDRLKKKETEMDHPFSSRSSSGLEKTVTR
jgi:hypothetical protein